MNLILFERGELLDGGRVVLSDSRAVHIRSVLRAQPGDSLRVGMLDGPLGRAEVVRVEEDEVELRCSLNTDVTPRPSVDLLLALPRPKVMKRLWAQLAALGVGRIILTNAWKVERNYFDTHVLNPAFYRPLLIEGLQQAQDTRLPEVSIHRQFKILVEDELEALFPDGLRLVAHPRSGTAVPGALGDDRRRTLLAVGPEGGWTDFELDLLQAHRFVPVRMGARTLRTDTAVVGLLTLVSELRRP